LNIEAVLNERPAESACTLALEISEELEQALRSEHMRLSTEANPPIDWDRFMEATLLIGLDKLKRIPALEALDRIDALEG
jgi:hypothetical protein